MVTLFHHIFDNDYAPSLSKMLRHDSHSSPLTSIFVNTSNVKNNTILVQSNYDIEVEDVCLLEDEDGIIQPTKISKSTLPVSRGKSVESSSPIKTNQMVFPIRFHLRRDHH